MQQIVNWFLKLKYLFLKHSVDQGPIQPWEVAEYALEHSKIFTEISVQEAYANYYLTNHTLGHILLYLRSSDYFNIVRAIKTKRQQAIQELESLEV